MESLKVKRLLIVLDNCEHLISACTELATEILRNCPGVRLLTPADMSEHDAARVLADGLYYDGVMLADLGYRSKKQELGNWLMDECSLTIVTPADGELFGGKAAKHCVGSVRQRVETTFSALWRRYIDQVFSRSRQGLWTTLELKMLHYNLCQAGVITLA